MTTVGGVKTQSTQDTYSKSVPHRCEEYHNSSGPPQGAESELRIRLPSLQDLCQQVRPQNVALKASWA